MSRSKEYLENYSSHIGEFNKGKTAQEGFMRAHIFPIGALKNILQTKFEEESSLLNSAFNIKEELGIKTSSSTSEQFKFGLVKTRDSGLNPLYDLVPFIVIPKSLENAINQLIRKYAIKATPIIDGTGNHHKQGSSKRSAIIVNESDFAEKYPSVYLDIFGYLLEKYLQELEGSGDKESALSLRASYQQSIKYLHQFTRKIFSLDEKLDVDEEKTPLSYSDEEGEEPARKIRTPYTKPSLNEFITFFEESLAAKKVSPEEIKEDLEDELFKKISSIDDKKLKAKIKELGFLCKALRNELSANSTTEETPSPLSIEESFAFVNNLSDGANKNLEPSKTALLKNAKSMCEEISSKANNALKKDAKEGASYVEKVQKNRNERKSARRE